MNRTHKAGWGFVTGLASAGITVLVSLAATPLLLKWLGQEKFGAFRAANDWTGHLMVFDLGLSGALTPLLVRALGQGNQAVRAVLGVGVRLYLGVVLLILMAGIGLTLFISRLVPVSPSLAGDLEHGCWLGILALLAAPLMPFRALAEADQRSYLINTLILFQTFIVTGLGLLLAWSGGGISGQFLAFATGSVVFLLLLTLDGRRRWFVPSGMARHLPTHKSEPAGQSFAGAATSPPTADLTDPNAIRREVWKLNWPNLIQNICGRIGLYTDNLLIAFFWGPALVVPFFLTQRMAVLAQTQLQGVGNSCWAGLVELASKGPSAVFQRRLIEVTSFVVILGVAVMVPLAAFNRTFITLWVGPEAFGGEAVTILAGVNAVLLAVFSLWGLVLSGAGHVARVVPGVVAATVVNIITSVIGAATIGLPGPVLGTSLSFVLVYSWYFPLLLNSHFQVPWRKLYPAIARPVIIGLPYALLIGWFARAHPPRGWVPLGLEIVSSALIYLLLAWITIFKSAERAEWMHRLRLFWRPWPAR
jgi:O-antigen/teichoic acid export membrane protein